MMVGLLLAACGDDDTSDAAAPEATDPASASTTAPDEDPARLRIATFNAGLAEGFVPLATERQPLVAEALAGLDAEVVFLQEVWSPEAVAELTETTSATFPEAVFPEPVPDTELGDPACTVDELADLEACIAQNCADAGPDELVECVLTNCATQYAGLCEECQSCIAANVGNTIEEGIANCTTASSAFAYDGSVGIGLLSKAVILDTDVLVLESSLNRRAVLHALVDVEGFGPVNVFGTHLSAVFSDIPYPGEGTWEEEQATQIADVLAYIETRTEPGDPVVLLGDFNTGPAGALYQAEIAANYELLTAGMLTNPYVEADDARCTFCGDNPLVGGDAAVVIDHVFTRNVEATAEAERILDGPIVVDVDGSETTTALSDHYGVTLSLTRDAGE